MGAEITSPSFSNIKQSMGNIIGARLLTFSKGIFGEQINLLRSTVAWLQKVVESWASCLQIIMKILWQILTFIIKLKFST